MWKNLKGYYVAYNNDGMAWPYWLRTPVTDCNHDMRYISSSGQVGRYAPWYSDLGVRYNFGTCRGRKSRLECQHRAKHSAHPRPVVFK